MNKPRLFVRQLGCQEYLSTWQAMRKFTLERTPETASELWIVEHPAVFTQGQAGKPEHILNAGDIPVIQTDRGGQVTYHGPGQLVVYVLLSLREAGLGVRSLVSAMENAIISLLADYAVAAKARADAPGVYVQDAKIASLGLRIKRGYSYHGLALNVAMDLSPFQRINPCGYQGLAVTQMQDLGVKVDMPGLTESLVRILCDQLGYSTHNSRTNIVA